MAIDDTGRQPGRGAYLCRDAACFDLAARRRALAHALGTPIPPDVERRIAAGPDNLGDTLELHRASGPRTETPHHTITEGGAHGQE